MTEPTCARPQIRLFETGAAAFEVVRTAADGGVQQVGEWIAPKDGHHNSIGVAELRRIRIADYEFGFSDFLYVLEGGVRITGAGAEHELRPGQAILIEKGTCVTIEVPDRLLWLYVTDPGNWRELATEPRAIDAL